MDDKNNEIIDFSNQPLGLMAQEGEKIEKEVNATTNDFNKPIENPNVQDNPFADVNASQNTSPVKEEVPTTPVEQPVEQPAPIEPAPAPAQPVQPVAAENPVPQEAVQQEQPVTPVLSPEEQKQKEIDELLAGKKQPEQPQSESSNASFIMFFVLVAIVAGAIFVFKSGKFDSLLDPKKEDETVQVEEKNTSKEETNQEQNNPEQNNTEQNNPEQSNVENNEQKQNEKAINPQDKMTMDYNYRSTLYILVDNTDIYLTSTGTMSLITNTAKGDFVLTLRGHMSQRFDQYLDYNHMVNYSNIVENGKSQWYKEPIEKKLFSPEDELITISKFKPDTYNDGDYKVTLHGNDIKAVLSDQAGKYIDLKKLKNKNVVVEYTVENCKIKKIKYDLTQVIEDAKKAYIVEEYSNYNTGVKITIPDQVVKSAKKIS